MYKILKCDKDAYITDKVIKGNRVSGSNVGGAGTLDLFKLYGSTFSASSPNVELSRLLIHFDMQPIRDLIAAGKLDVSNSSFNCTVKLFDVYGGQPTPNNFTISLYPLSRSFDEGQGRDVAFYSDLDVCNFKTGSRSQGSWIMSGCASGGYSSGPSCDFITASSVINSGASLKSTQLFASGVEDLSIDVTTIVSATLAGLLPDLGFRISYDTTHENDTHSYFVKRFSSRTAYNEEKRPKLIVKYDDSVQDDSQNMYMDSTSYIFMYNYARQSLANILSGSSLTPIVGQNCIILKLSTEISGGVHNLIFTGSQHKIGTTFVSGVYSSSVYIPSSDQVVAYKLAQSGSVKFTPIWGSIDDTVAYVTGSSITVFPPQRGGAMLAAKQFVVSALGLLSSVAANVTIPVRINIFDHTSPYITIVKTPVTLAGIVVRDVHYQIRNYVTNNIEIPFDVIKNSTRASSDINGMFFMLNTDSLVAGRSYVIDVMIVTANGSQTYTSASPVFRVSDTQ